PRLVIAADDSRPGAPLTRAVFDMAMEDFPALLNTQGDGVGRAPFIKGARIEEGDQSVPGAFLDLQRSGGSQDVVERSGSETLRVVSRFCGGTNQAANLAGSSTGVGRAWTPPKILADDLGFDQSVVMTLPARVL